MSTAVVNGVELHYISRGEGSDVVMIHGLGANIAFWYMYILPRLAREFRVLAYDLRGHGYSAMPASGYTSASLAADLLGLLDQLGLASVHLVGHSFGGAVALHFAVQHPERVRTVTMADARLAALQPRQSLKDWQHWPMLRARLAALSMPLPDDEADIDFTLLEQWARFSARRPARPEAFTEFIPFVTGSGGPRTSRLWLQLLRASSARQDFRQAGPSRQEIKEVQHPVLAMYGQYSHCLETLRGLQASLPRCRVVVVPKVGHFHPIVKRDVFVNTVRDFVREHAA
jgi:pimeloyl-ACP methyl ester carboxylesterase